MSLMATGRAEREVMLGLGENESLGDRWIELMVAVPPRRVISMTSEMDDGALQVVRRYRIGSWHIRFKYRMREDHQEIAP